MDWRVEKTIKLPDGAFLIGGTEPQASSEGCIQPTWAAPWFFGEGYSWTQEIKKGPTLSRKALKNMARPTGFESVTPSHWFEQGVASLERTVGRFAAVNYL